MIALKEQHLRRQGFRAVEFALATPYAWCVGFWWQRRSIQLGDGDECYAVHWTRLQTQFASCAFRLDNGVCELLCANDGIDRAGGDAKRASDAMGFIATRNLVRLCGWNLGR